MTSAQQLDFSKGSIFRHILRLAGPMTLAQLINVLYNIVDRIFVGQIGGEGSLALTGLGVCFPVITIVIAFTNLIGMGGAPLFSITRGAGDDEEAARILGNSFTLLLLFGVLLTAAGLAVKTPLLRALGASDATLPYADAYLTVYLFGSVFVSLSLGLNSFINAQGFARTGMLTVAIGAVLNLILDPLFIMVFHMGVQGAALATIQYVIALRLRKAKQLLLETDLPILDICAACGFQNQSYFTKAFREKTGTTPAQFRKRAR